MLSNKRYCSIYYIITFIFLTIGLSLTGCKQVASSSSTIQESDFSYTSNTYDIGNFQCPLFPVFRENILYFIDCNYNDLTFSKNQGKNYETKVYSYSIEKKQRPYLLPISLAPDCRVESMTINADNHLLFLISMPSVNNICAWRVDEFSMDGTLQASIDVTHLLNDTDSSSSQTLLTNNNGTFFLSNGESKILFFDKTGTAIQTLNNGDYISQILYLKNNCLFASTTTKDANYLLSINTEKPSLDNTLDLSLTHWSNISPTANYSLLFHSSDSLLGYEEATNTFTKLLKWTDCQLVYNDIFYVEELANREILIITSDTAGLHQIRLSHAKNRQVDTRKVITLSSPSISESLRRAIVDFNRNNTLYKVETVEYSGNATEQIEAIERDMVLGNATDIIDTTFLMQYQDYVTKNLLTDLYPYFQSDSTLDINDYLPNVLKAYEINRHLYVLPVSISIRTGFGKSKIWGYESGFSTEDFLKVDKNKKSGTYVFPATENKLLFFSLIRFNFSHYIDFETRIANFDTEEFKNLLEYTKEIDVWKKEDGNNTLSFVNEFQTEHILHLFWEISNTQDFQTVKAFCPNEDITFIGIPEINGNGSYFEATPLLSIYNHSNNKEAAWEFLKYFLTEEYQNNIGSLSFPIRKDSLELLFVKDMTPDYITNENGVQEELPKTIFQEYGGDFSTSIYHASEKDIEELRRLITTTTVAKYCNETIEDILIEEIGAFFAGDKSSDETIALIQNRVQLFLDEA